MSCNYKNIYDLCTNKYTYEYSKVKFISAVASSGFNEYAGSFTDVDPYSEVIRTDKDTGFREVITQYSTNNIEHCDFSTESQSITAWDCYQVYKQQGGTISEPTIEVFRDAKYKQITDEYNNSLINGISIVINDKTIILDASIDSQIYYRNIVNTAQALYNTDIDSTMPKFIDKNNTLYSFNYDNINNIFQQYFKKVIYYKNLKDILFKKIKDSDSINNIKTISWNTSVPIESDSVTTTIVNSNDITIPTCPLVVIECINNGSCPSGSMCSNGKCMPICDGWHPAFDGSSMRYEYATLYDYDCCYFGPAQPDGGFTVKYDCNGNGTIVATFGNYGSIYSIGQSYGYFSGHRVVSATKMDQFVVNAGCCNADGSAIYAELF